MRSSASRAPSRVAGATDEEAVVELTFVAKDPGSEPSGSPTLYRTDRGYWAVQGWVVTDQSALATMDIPPGESCVETPDRLVPFFTTRDRWSRVTSPIRPRTRCAIQPNAGRG
jgi:hypothetical protein